MVELTEAEAAVYDRQLRVWGIEVQKRYRLGDQASCCTRSFTYLMIVLLQVKRSSGVNSRMYRSSSRGEFTILMTNRLTVAVDRSQTTSWPLTGCKEYCIGGGGLSGTNGRHCMLSC